MTEETDNIETAEKSAKPAKPAKSAKPTGKGFPFTIVRHVVQVFMVMLFLVPVIWAGWPIFGGMTAGDTTVTTPSELFFYGTLSSSSIFGINLIDPFAALQSFFSSKTLAPEWLLGVLPILVFYALIRGRAFCGWVCPVNLLLEIVDWLRKKLGIKVEERVLPRRLKIWVAIGVLALSALLSVPVFEILNPISFINKGLVFGSMAGGLTLLAALLVDLFWGHRVFCRAICPLGGFWQVVGKVGLVNVRIDHDACVGCDKCKKACLCDPEILEAAVAGKDDMVRAGDCMLCGKCVEACPTKALCVKPGRTPRPEEEFVIAD